MRAYSLLSLGGQESPSELRARGQPISQCRFLRVNRQQPGKKLWPLRQDADGPRPQPVISGQGQQQVSHKRGLSRLLAVCACVTWQVIAPRSRLASSAPARCWSNCGQSCSTDSKDASSTCLAITTTQTSSRPIGV